MGIKKDVIEDAKNTAEVLKNIKENITNHTLDDGSEITMKAGIKKKGKILKFEIEYDKDFIADNVSINIKAGCNRIDLTSPKNSSEFSAKFSATKRF
jgi:hypothetical protein